MLSAGECPTEFGKPELIRVDRDPLKETTASLIAKRIKKVKAIEGNYYGPLLNQKLSAQVLPELETVRLYPATGLVPEGAKFSLVGLHGAAAMYSSAETMVKMIRYWGDSGPTKKGTNTRKLRNHPSFRLAAAEAPDIIGHGMGPLASENQGKEMATDYLVRYLQRVKKERPNLPLIVWVRSSSGILIENVVQREPNLIDGIVLMSSPVPKNEWLKNALETLLQMESEGILKTNAEGLDWVERVMYESTWNLETVFGKVPTYILTGSRDPEMMEYERQYYRDLAAARDNISYRDVLNAEHDILKSNHEYRDSDIVNTMKGISDFIAEIVDSKNP